MVKQEIEKKKLITHGEYIDYMSMLSNVHPFYRFHYEDIIQINYYYDDSSFSLHRLGETLRVRQIDNSLVLERKFNKRYSENTRICEESSCDINYLPISIMVEEKIYKLLGNMITNRRNFIIDDIIISLDKSMYLGIIDYEIEIESTKFLNLPEVISQMIFTSSKGLGKYSRFVQQYKKSNESFIL